MKLCLVIGAAIFLAGCTSSRKVINVSFVETFCAEDKFVIPSAFSESPRRERIQRDDGTWVTRVPGLSPSHANRHLRGTIDGLPANIYYYDNMILTRITVPNEQHTEIGHSLTRRYGKPAKTNTKFRQWEITRGRQKSYVTLHCKGTENSQAHDLPERDTFTLDVSRMLDPDNSQARSNNAIESDNQ